MKTFKGYCELKIWDNGKGIENEEISKLFEPFNSGKIGGTGLGLSIVREIISNHKGEITFESEAGKWTEITIKFNLYKEE
jgi:signal transduction histidine kinase